MGLGPEGAQKGDMVCVLLGGNVPFLLRRNERHYLLVGESYVHGFMEGKAMNELDEGRLELRDFPLQ